MFDNIIRGKNGRFRKNPSSSVPKTLNLIKLKKRIAEDHPLIKSEPEVSFELDATCIDENNDQSSGPLSIQSNDQKPSELELEEPTSAKNSQDYFLIKEIGAIKTDDVEYVINCEYQNDDAEQDDGNDLGQRRTFRACRERSKLKETLQQKQERLWDEIIGKLTKRNEQQRTNQVKGKRRENEIFEQTKKRLLRERIWKQKCRANETFEQRQKRLLREKIRTRKVRENETFEQKRQRLLNCKYRQRKRRKRETFEQRQKRLLRQKIRTRKVRENETFEQKRQRLLNQTLSERKRRENETPEEKKKRLIAGRIKQQRHRYMERLSSFRDYQRQCREKMESEVEKHLCVTIYKQECVDE